MAPADAELALERARARLRQDPGGRSDAAAAPHADLMLARRSMALFARALNQQSESALWQQAGCGGALSRREIIAHIACFGRDLAEQAAMVRTGQGQRQWPDADSFTAAVTLVATLPDGALRHLIRHVCVHLNVEWRDLGDPDWGVPALAAAPPLWAMACQMAARIIAPSLPQTGLSLPAIPPGQAELQPPWLAQWNIDLNDRSFP